MKKLPNQPGVYIITHEPTGRFYVGSTTDLYFRIASHKSELNRGMHGNRNLQEVYTRPEDLQITVVPAETLDSVRDAEQELLDLFLPNPLCCNIGTGSRSLWAVGKVPEEMKEKASRLHLGNTYGKGHVVTEEMREAVRRANTGLKRSDETLAKMRRQVSINGVIYSHAAAAAVALNILKPTVVYRINSASADFEGWKYV